jgi:hypothetical protein
MGFPLPRYFERILSLWFFFREVAMEMTSTTLIIIGVVCIVLGFFASVLLNTLREEDAQSYEDDAQSPPGGKKGRFVSVVRLWRDKKTGVIVVEKEGKSYVNPSPLSDTQHSELEQVARDFRAWLGMGLSANAESSIQPKAWVAAPGEVAQAPTSAVGTTEPSRIPAPSFPAPARTTQVSMKKPIQAAAVQTSVAPAAAPAVAHKSIVMQIEDILQDMLAGNPLEIRGIHLTEDPTRGVIVSVSGERFEGIDAVPDPEIRGMIRAAVVQWENSQ